MARIILTHRDFSEYNFCVDCGLHRASAYEKPCKPKETTVTEKATPKIASTGGSTEYYDLPKNAKTLYDLIEFKGMNFSEGNVFKAIFRMGSKAGTDELYDWNKIKFCAEREIKRIKKEMKDRE